MTSPRALYSGPGPVVVAFASDDNYALPLGVALHSILSHLTSGPDYRFYVVDGGISDKNRRRIARIAERFEDLQTTLTWLTPDPGLVNELHTPEHISIATYFRLQIANLLPRAYSRALFLDPDILVTKNLLELWSLACSSDAAVMAVQDILVPMVSSPGGVVDFRKHDVRPDAKYLNAGILSLNLDAWRSQDLGTQVLRHLREFRGMLTLHDQEGINALLADSWDPLDPRWNVQTAMYDRLLCQSAWGANLLELDENLTSDGAIYHFTGKWKPWHLECTHPMKPLWHRHLAETGWYDPIEAQASCADLRSRAQSATERSQTGAHKKAADAHPTIGGSTAAKVTIQAADDGTDRAARVVSHALAMSGDSTATVWLVDNFGGPGEGSTPAVPEGVTVTRSCNAFPASSWLRLKDTLVDWQSVAPSELLIVLPDDAPPEALVLERIGALMERNSDLGLVLCNLVRDEVGSADAGVGVGVFGEEIHRGDSYFRRVMDGALDGIDDFVLALRRSAVEELKRRQPNLDELARHGKDWAVMTLSLELAEERAIATMSWRPEAGDPDASSRVTADDQLPGVAEIGALGVRIDAGTRILNRTPPRDPGEIGRDLGRLNDERSALVAAFVPVTAPSMEDARREFGNLFVRHLPPGATFILLGSDVWTPVTYRDRRAIPLIEKNGQNWGDPEDDAMAAEALNTRIADGATHLVLTRHAFWWREHYRDFMDHVASAYPCIHRCERLLIFELRRQTGPT